MDSNQRELLRDNIASLVLRHYPDAMAPLTQARITADAIMAELFGGAYVVTQEGRDYLADHRYALAGGRAPIHSAFACAPGKHHMADNPSRCVKCGYRLD